MQTGRLRSRQAAYVFPLVCALGGVLLLAHTHSLGNIKEELLAEMSHLLGAGGGGGWLDSLAGIASSRKRTAHPKPHLAYLSRHRRRHLDALPGELTENIRWFWPPTL
ncbi:MAG: hypothetical protein U0V70_14000 [Terriglobia bacterium]